jgi:tight adherence protein C
MPLNPMVPLVLASSATGLATWFALTLAGRGIYGLVSRSGLSSDFERSRRQHLVEGNATYRTFESLVERLAAWDATHADPAKLAHLRSNLAASGIPLPWTPSEYRAAKMVEGGLLGIFLAALFTVLSKNPLFGAIPGLVMALVLYQVGISDVASKVKARELTIRRPLPYVVDLMALMMEAGAGFPEALTTVAREFAGTPLGDEWGRVLRDIEMGRPRSEAIAALRDRIRSDDLAEIVFAINKGEELGTPLSQILKNQAAQLRIKRSQWIEKASAEAEVKIAFPGLVIMVACMLVVGTPFLLQGAFQFFGE